MRGTSARPYAEAVLFGELLETSRVFLCGTTRIPAHALLLSAVHVECDLAAERILIDRWFMLRVETPVRTLPWVSSTYSVLSFGHSNPIFM